MKRIDVVLVMQLSLGSLFHFAASKLVLYATMVERSGDHDSFSTTRWTEHEQNVFNTLLDVIFQYKVAFRNTACLLYQTDFTFKILKPQTSS